MSIAVPAPVGGDRGMIHTVAIYPACRDTFDRFQRFLTTVGRDRGRLLLQLPMDYRRHLGAAMAGWTPRQQALGEQFGHGLDRSRYEDGALDDVTLLDGEHWRQRLAEFEAAGSLGAVAHPVPTERDRRRAAMRRAGSSMNIPGR